MLSALYVSICVNFIYFSCQHRTNRVTFFKYRSNEKKIEDSVKLFLLLSFGKDTETQPRSNTMIIRMWQTNFRTDSEFLKAKHPEFQSQATIYIYIYLLTKLFDRTIGTKTAALFKQLVENPALSTSLDKVSKRDEKEPPNRALSTVNESSIRTKISMGIKLSRRFSSPVIIRRKDWVLVGKSWKQEQERRKISLQVLLPYRDRVGRVFLGETLARLRKGQERATSVKRRLLVDSSNRGAARFYVSPLALLNHLHHGSLKFAANEPL